MGVRGQRHTPAALYSRERPGTHCTGGWVGPRAGRFDSRTVQPVASRHTDYATRLALLHNAYDKYRENLTVAVTELGDFSCFFFRFVLSLTFATYSL
jgi:hypothetical protein